jgi:hypothetical protein
MPLRALRVAVRAGRCSRVLLCAAAVAALVAVIAMGGSGLTG